MLLKHTTGSTIDKERAPAHINFVHFSVKQLLHKYSLSDKIAEHKMKRGAIFETEGLY